MNAADLAIVVLVSALAIALHVALFVLFRRWMDRDLALSFAGDDAGKRRYMLDCLARAKRERVAQTAAPDSAGTAKAGVIAVPAANAAKVRTIRVMCPTS